MNFTFYRNAIRRAQKQIRQWFCQQFVAIVIVVRAPAEHVWRELHWGRPCQLPNVGPCRGLKLHIISYSSRIGPPYWGFWAPSLCIALAEVNISLNSLTSSIWSEITFREDNPSSPFIMDWDTTTLCLHVIHHKIPHSSDLGLLISQGVQFSIS